MKSVDKLKQFSYNICIKKNKGEMDARIRQKTISSYLDKFDWR